MLNYFVTILIFCEDCLSLEDFCSYLYLPWPHEGSTYSVVLTQLSEDLAWLGCVSPCIVPFSARREQSEAKWVRFSFWRVHWQIRNFHPEICFMVSGPDIFSVKFFFVQHCFFLETPPLSAQVLEINHSFLLKHRRSWGSIAHSLDKVCLLPMRKGNRACSLLYLKDSSLHVLPPFKENYSAALRWKDELRLCGTWNKHIKKYLTLEIELTREALGLVLRSWIAFWHCPPLICR